MILSARPIYFLRDPRQLQIAQEHQRPNERVAYPITLHASFPSPGMPVCTLYDVTTETDVSLTKLSGSASIVAQLFTTPLVIDLVVGHTYRLTCRFASGGSTFEPFVMIDGVE